MFRFERTRGRVDRWERCGEGRQREQAIHQGLIISLEHPCHSTSNGECKLQTLSSQSHSNVNQREENKHEGREVGRLRLSSICTKTQGPLAGPSCRRVLTTQRPRRSSSGPTVHCHAGRSVGLWVTISTPGAQVMEYCQSGSICSGFRPTRHP